MKNTSRPHKYPKTPHLPFSPTIFKDDISLNSCNHFLNREVVITEKLDGGNCQLFQGKVYARTTSHEAKHDSFQKIRSYYPMFSYKQPKNLAIFGENMLAIHSIDYDKLSNFFFVFSMFDASEMKWFGWEKVSEYAKEFELDMVPVLFRGKFKKSKDVKKWMDDRMKGKSIYSETVGPEGFVIRIVEEFKMKDFEKSIAKYVRQNHIQTDKNWKDTWKKAKIKKK